MGIGRSRWYRIILLLFLIWLTAFVDRSNIGMAAPVMVKSLGVESGAVGVLLSAFFWGYVITQIPGGWIAAKISAKTVIVVSLVVWSVMAMLTGLVPSFNGILVVRFLMGMAEGAVWPSFAVIFVNWFPPNERARAISLNMLALPISSIIMAPVAGWMIHAWNYHTMFILQGIPPLIMAAIFGWLGSDSPEKDRYISESERTFLLEYHSTSTPESGSVLKALVNHRVWILGITVFFWECGLTSFGLWLPSLINQLSHSGIQVIGLLSAVPFIFAAVAMYLNSVWSDRHGLNRTWFVAVPLLISGMALVVEHFIGFNLVINMILLIVVGIGLYAAWGPWWAWCTSFVPRNQAGPAIGLINLIGNFGGIVGPIIVGIAAHSKNLINGFYILGIAMLVSFAFVVFVAGRLRMPEEKSDVVSADFVS